MATLQEIHDRTEALGHGGIPTTGQTECWTSSGSPVNCTGTGQDGEFRAGISVDPRFTDNGDGTVRDNLTGLIWLKEADCLGSQAWIDAMPLAMALASGSCGLTDGSEAGNWRLPNARELQSLIDFGHTMPALPPGHPFIGSPFASYWSSTSSPMQSQEHAWYVGLQHGKLDNQGKSQPWTVWPVRSPQ
jgi:hypothetical protein